MAVEALCRRDTNLITFEATIQYLLDDIHKSKSHYHKKYWYLLTNELFKSVTLMLQKYFNIPVSKTRENVKWKNIIRKSTIHLLFLILPYDEEFPISEDGKTVLRSYCGSRTRDIPLAKKLLLAIDASIANSSKFSFT